MKKYFFASLTFLAPILTSGAEADDPLAHVQVINALRINTNINSEELERKDYKSYFSSDRFESDYKNGKWSGGVKALVDGAPVGLSANASQEELSKFKESVKKSTQFEVLTETSYRFAESHLSVEGMREYGEWLDKLTPGLKVKLKEDDGQFVVFDVSFSKTSEIVPWPTLSALQVFGGLIQGNEDYSNRKLNKPFSVTVRREKESDVTFILQTDLGGVVKKKAYPDDLKRKSDLPVGTIITSMLPLDQFLIAVGEKTPYQSEKSSWAPADGRAVSSDPFFNASRQNTVIDLRGCFVRGLNVFDPTYHIPVDEKQADPDKIRKPLGLQEDAFEKHKHGFVISGRLASTRGGGRLGTATDQAQGYTTEEAGKESETRPTNRAVYFYVKIR